MQKHVSGTAHRYRTSASLTARELTWLGLCANGLTDFEIAGAMNITVHTVRFHAGALMKKLGASNRAHAVYLAMKRGSLQ